MTQGWNYQRWNEALGRHFFRPELAGEDVFLATDRYVLSKVSGLEESEAEASFLASIHSVCGPGSRDVTNWARDSLVPFRRNGPDWRPFCCALLCFQVFVAFQMEWVEGERTAANYWGTMNKLLGFGLESTYPKGLKPELHQSLWRECLARWANDPAYHGMRLGHLVLPPADDPEGSGHRHIKLPLSQALLRREDCLQLYRFFDDEDLRPGETMAAETLADRLECRKPDLSTHARRVLDDPLRREAALGQLVRLLVDWDGSCPERTRKNAYAMWMRFSKRRPGRLQVGIAKVGREELEDRREVPLEQLLAADCQLDDVAYRPLHRNLRILVRNDSLGCFLEQRYAGPEQEVLLLLPARDPEGVLSLLTHAKIAPERLEVELPFNWRFYWLETPRNLPPLPFFEPQRLTVRAVGGLKLGPGVWIAGAGPSIRVSGKSIPKWAWMDGNPIAIEAGDIHDPRLSRPGRHQLVIPGRGVAACFHVQEPEELGKFEPPFWKPVGRAWPEPEAPSSGDIDYLLGFQVVGSWPAQPPQHLPAQLPRVAEGPAPAKEALPRLSQPPKIIEDPLVAQAPPSPPQFPEIADESETENEPLPPHSEPGVAEEEPASVPTDEPLPTLAVYNDRQALLVRLLVSLRRGVPLVSPSELLEGSKGEHAVVRALCFRLMVQQRERCS